MTICYPLLACDWLQNGWPRMTLSGYFVSKSAFGQHFLTQSVWLSKIIAWKVRNKHPYHRRQKCRSMTEVSGKVICRYSKALAWSVFKPGWGRWNRRRLSAVFPLLYLRKISEMTSALIVSKSRSGFLPVSQNEIAPRKIAPGEKHVRPLAEFVAIKSAGGRTCFSPTPEKFRWGAKILKCAVKQTEWSARYLWLVMAPIADLCVILNVFSWLSFLRYCCFFSNKLWYELSGPSNVYTYMCALHLLSCLFRVRVFIKCLKLYAFSIILTTFFSQLYVTATLCLSRTVLYKGHDTRRTLIATSHQPPLRIQRRLLPGQRSRFKRTSASLHTEHANVRPQRCSAVCAINHCSQLLHTCVNCTTKHCRRRVMPLPLSWPLSVTSAA